MSENERLREALRDMIALSVEDDSMWELHEESFRERRRAARNALAAKPDVCVWHRKTDTGGDPYGPWITSCGQEWDLQGPEGLGPFEYPDEYGFEFCPFTSCGSKIEVKGE